MLLFNHVTFFSLYFSEFLVIFYIVIFLYMVFIDLEKAYDKIPTKVLWRVLEKKWVWIAYIQALKDMYHGVETKG